MSHGKISVGAILLVATAWSPATAAGSARKWDVSLSGRISHESNVSGTAPSQAKLRNLTPEDTSYAPTLNLDLVLPVSNQSLFLRGGVGYVFHQNNKNLDSEVANLAAGAAVTLSACNNMLTGTYARNVRDQADLIISDKVKNVVDTKGIRLDINCSRPSGLGISASGSFTRGDNSSIRLEPTNSEARSYSLGVTYHRPALGTLTVFGSETRVEYPDRVASSVQGGGFINRSVGVTIDRQLGARIEGTVTVASSNIKQIDPLTTAPASKNRNSITYSADLSYRPTSRLRTQAHFSRDVIPTVRLGNAYDISTSYRISGSYTLGSRISLDLGATQSDLNSQSPTVLSALSLTNSRTKSVVAGVNYAQSRRLSLRLDFEHLERVGDNPIYNFNDDRVGLTTNFKY